MRYVELCVFQWLPDQKMYTKIFTSHVNDVKLEFGMTNSLAVHQIKPIEWPLNNNPHSEIGINSYVSGEFDNSLYYFSLYSLLLYSSLSLFPY